MSDELLNNFHAGKIDPKAFSFVVASKILFVLLKMGKTPNEIERDFASYKTLANASHTHDVTLTLWLAGMGETIVHNYPEIDFDAFHDALRAVYQGAANPVIQGQNTTP